MIDEASLLRRYLLGELDESEQEVVEKKLMTSDEQYQELLIAEDELVDDYHAGLLDAEQEEEYRHRFLVTSERHRQHRFGAALRRRIADADEQTDPSSAGPWSLRAPWKLSLAAAVVVAAIAAGVWSVRIAERTPVRLEPAAEATESTTQAFFLTARNLRSLEAGTEQTISVPDGITTVELQLDVPDDARAQYDVTLEDVSSEAVLAEGTLPARTIEGQRVVVARVPSELLMSGEYRVVLRETTGESVVVETFEFRVTPQ